MRINKIEIQNFKSIGHQVFEFNDVNVLVGANASGKSNFIQIFEFLKSIKKDGIQKAVTVLGGINNIMNFNTTSRRLSIKIEVSPKPSIVKFETELQDIRLIKNTDKIVYELKLRDTNNNTFDFKEELIFEQYFSVNKYEDDEIGEEIERHQKRFTYGVTKNYDGRFELSEPEETTEFWTVFEGIEQTQYKLDFITPFNIKTIEELNSRSYFYRSILEYQGLFMPADLFDFGIYDINSKILKDKTDNSYATTLNKDGSNLPVVVRGILSSEDAEQFIADVAGILDFIENIRIVPFETMLDLRIKEKYSSKETRGNLISDGTVCAIAFIVALYYQDNSIVFIEEPEHSLHPSLIDDVIRAVYDVVEYLDKQIIITTHSPDLLRHLKSLNNDLTDLVMISRKDDGSSTLARPISKEMVKAFLDAELGIDELFIQNLLND